MANYAELRTYVLTARTFIIRNNFPNSEVVVCMLRESGTCTMVRIRTRSRQCRSGIGWCHTHRTSRSALLLNESIQRQHGFLAAMISKFSAKKSRSTTAATFQLFSLSRKENAESASSELSNVLRDPHLPSFFQLGWLTEGGESFDDSVNPGSLFSVNLIADDYSRTPDHLSFSSIKLTPLSLLEKVIRTVELRMASLCIRS